MSYPLLWLGNFAPATQTQKAFSKLRRAEGQADVRPVFSQFGLPRGIQTDREHLYGQPAQEAFPATFRLWLVGLPDRTSFQPCGAAR